MPAVPRRKGVAGVADVYVRGAALRDAGHLGRKKMFTLTFSKLIVSKLHGTYTGSLGGRNSTPVDGIRGYAWRTTLLQCGGSN